MTSAVALAAAERVAKHQRERKRIEKRGLRKKELAE